MSDQVMTRAHSVIATTMYSTVAGIVSAADSRISGLVEPTERWIFAVVVAVGSAIGYTFGMALTKHYLRKTRFFKDDFGP